MSRWFGLLWRWRIEERLGGMEGLAWSRRGAVVSARLAVLMGPGGGAVRYGSARLS